MNALILAFVLQSPLASEAPLAVSDIVVPQAAESWLPVEISFTLKGTWSNALDPREVSAMATISSKDLFAEVPCVVITPPHKWALRFAPWAAGKFRVEIFVRDTLARYSVKPFDIDVKRPSETRKVPGFVEVRDKQKYFLRSDGKPVLLISSGDRFSDDSNLILLDGISPFDKPQNFGLSRIAELEAKLAAAVEGQYFMLTLGSEEWLKNWSANPFNMANGGPCETPDAFFQSLQARLAYKRYLRYLVGRLNHLPSWAGVLLWKGAAPEYWLEEMADEFRALHPYPVPVVVHPIRTDWFSSQWLRSGACELSELRQYRTLPAKPIFVFGGGAGEAIANGAAAVFGQSSQGLLSLLSSLDFKRKFEHRAITSTTARGSALIDDAGGFIWISADNSPTGTIGLAVKRDGLYRCEWYQNGKLVTTTSATSKSGGIEIPHPALQGELVGLLKR